MEWGGIRLLTDPTFDPSGSEYATAAYTLSKTAGPALDPDSLGPIDAVLLSHDHHFDNLDRAGRSFLSKARLVITTLEGANRLGGNAVGLAPWQHVTVPIGNQEGLSVTGTPARHGPADADRGPVIGFVLQRAGTTGPAIYNSGDTVFFAGVRETLQRFSNIRAAILFMGAAKVPALPWHITFTADEAIGVAEALPNAAIIPVHYEGWKHFTESRMDIDQTFAVAGLGNRLLWLTAGKQHEFPLGVVG
jgi:L-ascorbate metabolism protein UlaG (beta-lactamase superfamily)